MTAFQHGDTPCEREAIHAPGAIQGHATLLCVDPDTLAVLGMTENVGAILPHAALTRHRPRLNHFLTPQICDLVVAALKDGRLNRQGLTLKLAMDLVPPHGGEVFIHHHHDVIFCEIEARDTPDLPPTEPIDTLQDILVQIRDSASFNQLVSVVADSVRKFTGMERVLVYRFDRDGHGEVIGESLASGFEESFLGFHFPADDIPPQARALYAISPLRYTPERDYTPVLISPATNPKTGQPFDLSLCRCRSVSPIHAIYQKNLGVDGSMSISVIDDGHLWGLIVCHHRQPCRVSMSARRRVLSVANAFSMRLHATETTEEKEARALHVSLHARLLEQIAGADDFVAPLVDGNVKLTDIFFASSGAAVVYDEGAGRPKEVRTVGLAPSADAVVRLAEYCRQHLDQGVYACDCISRKLPEFERFTAEASGVLGISVGDQAQHMILWFRPEIVKTTVWGGATPSAVADHKQQGNYFPRQSFERWVVERRGYSRPWTHWKIDIARSLRTALNDVILRQLRTIRSLNERLTESDKAKSRFLAHMSHELRTPLNAILGFSEAIMFGIYGSISDNQRESTGHIHTAAQHLLSMINDILDLSKVEAGRMELSRVELDLDKTIREAVQLMGSLIQESGITLEFKRPESLTVLHTDRRALIQMVMNLVSNAVKFTPSGGRITIELVEELAGGVTLAVSDTGQGIPAHLLQHVLEPFRQADQNMALARKGTGLGLPLVKSLMEVQGGTLSLSSELEIGTTVRLHFPREASARE
ncbi:ATP-binding protein [Paramagnetospirillum kuznetsovii]|uniref:ATP-binding protein n=1 Tax=Paramagnetospirillum kuznetsovii TaxID=2053833 RepID=UPI001375164F|nr:ATP-binding protein [Paramagnetospirillum kuznetsovii]